jgi:hypothetical protein
MLITSASGESSNEVGCNTLQIDMKLADGKIACQELFVNTPKLAHKVSHKRPHAFDRVDMNFADAIAVIVPRPFFLRMTNRVVRTINVVVALPFIGIDVGIVFGELLDMGAQGRLVGMFNHP